ncbi:hypothetical protein ACISNT_09330, partial [Campylobacter jejuni]
KKRYISISIIRGIVDVIVVSCCAIYLRIKKKTRKNINKVILKLSSFLKFGSIKQENTNK